MLKRLRTVLVLIAIAAFACGNALNAMAGAAEPLGSVNGRMAAAAHTHVHTSGHAHDAMADVATDHSTSACQGSLCDAGDHPDSSCCHIHAHCCGFAGFLPVPLILAALTSSGQYFAHFDGAVPLGGIVYPLLRPPRLAV